MVCPFAFRFEEENVPDHTEYVAAAFLRRYVVLDFVCVEEEADLVVILRCGKCDDAGDLSGAFSLALLHRSKNTGGTQIDQKHDSELTFFAEDFNEGTVHLR